MTNGVAVLRWTQVSLHEFLRILDPKTLARSSAGEPQVDRGKVGGRGSLMLLWSVQILIILCLIIQDDQVDDSFFDSAFLKNHWTVCQLQAMRVAVGSMKWFLMACSLLVNSDDVCDTFDLCRGCSDVDVPVVLQWLQTYIRSTHRSIGSTKESHNSHKVTVSLYYVSIRANPKWMFWHVLAMKCFQSRQCPSNAVATGSWLPTVRMCGALTHLNTRFQASILFEGFRARSTRETRVSFPSFQKHDAISLHNSFGSLLGHQDHVWTLRRIISKLGNEIIMRA